MKSLPLALLGLFMPILLLGCHGTRPASLGVHEGKLAACPGTPNCVSSQAVDQEHRIAPLTFTGSPADALRKLKTILGTLPRTAIITETDAYLHAECTSLLFRFIDDVEFLVDDKTPVIHLRSAARLGKSDLGVNRKRIETIRKQWENGSS
jgi:uncharacterized protein (DUF1499 family)